MIPSVDEFGRLLRSPVGRGVAARLAWGGLLAMHGPAVVSATATLLAEPTAGGALRFLALLLTIAFFAFKACGGRVLPTRTRPWIATAAFLALTGLAHAGLMPTRAGDALADSVPTAIVFASVAAIGINRRRLIKRLDLLTDSFRRWLTRFNTFADRLTLAFVAFAEPTAALALAQRQSAGPAPTRGPPTAR